MRTGKNRGSFLPVLMKLVSMTDGPILELGMGFCSSPYLHWACYHTKRPLSSYENNPEYFKFAKNWRDGFHKIYCISDWDNTEFHKKPWNIAFIDHQPGSRRGIDCMRLKHADYLVIHDSENINARKHGLDKVYANFKFRYKYNEAHPYTSIWSDKYDVRRLDALFR